MSFGFSVGDVLAVGRLTHDIVSCLQDVGGAKSEYQELIRELECLQRAVQHLDKLESSQPSTQLDSIKYAALMCKQPLEEFLRKARKYDKSLGVWSKEGPIKSAVDKLRFGLGQKEEIRKLQSYLNIHVGIINVTLAEYGFEKMDIATGQATAERLRIRERLEETASMIKRIGNSLSLQTLLVENTQSLLTRLFETLAGELKTSWMGLANMVAQVFVSTQQTHGVVQEIRSSLNCTFTRMPSFQDPLIVEDALGFKFPFPSELDYDLLDVVIKRKFIDGPGSLEVKAGNYEFVHTQDSNKVLCRNSKFFPGMSITMAIIIMRPILTDEACPMPNCKSFETTSPPGGGRVCSFCGVWFSPTQRLRKGISHLLVAASVLSQDQPHDATFDDKERPPKRPRLTNVKEDVAMFRNVRLAERGMPPLEASNAVKSSASQETSTVPSSNVSSTEGGFWKDEVTNGPVLLQNAKPLDADDGDEPTQKLELSLALTYIQKLKVRCLPVVHVYEQFLETLKAYQLGELSIPDVYSKIREVLKNEPDLLEDFKTFIPYSVLQDGESPLYAHDQDRLKEHADSQDNHVNKSHLVGTQSHPAAIPDIRRRIMETLLAYEHGKQSIQATQKKIMEIKAGEQGLGENLKKSLVISAEEYDLLRDEVLKTMGDGHEGANGDGKYSLIGKMQERETATLSNTPDLTFGGDAPLPYCKDSQKETSREFADMSQSRKASEGKERKRKRE